MGVIDWSIVGVVLAVLTVMSLLTYRHTKNASDFLAANRCAGRYLLTVAHGMAGMGAITILGTFEMGYEAGFVSQWWGLLSSPVPMVMAITGWVIYRFRQTRALTMAQFLEVRYSRNFRVFYGIVAYLSGIINFGIFPAASARFFVYFCGFPQQLHLWDMSVPTHAVVMAVLVLLALFFTLIGGQITVIVTDFFQGVFVNAVFVIVLLYLFWKIDWGTIVASLQTAPEQKSLLNPFRIQDTPNFNFWFYAIGIFVGFYSSMVWPGAQGYNVSATTAHEAKMARIVSQLRLGGPLLFIMISVCVYTVMHHAQYADVAAGVSSVLDTMQQGVSRNQMIVPVTLTYILPKGMIGAFAAVIFAAFISTHDTYMHSWGSTLIQDVILPFRKTPFTPRQHLWLLRGSICFVAVFIYCFSLFYKLTIPIFMFFFISSAIFLAGAGAVVIGGLYWKRGTTAAAWCAMVTGMALSIISMFILLYKPNFFLNAAEMSFFIMFCCSVVYVTVSLLHRKEDFEMDRMLHRGKYAIKDEKVTQVLNVSRGLRALGITNEFTRFDRVLFFALVIWSLGWFIIFLTGTAYKAFFGLPETFWPTYWRYWSWLMLVAFSATTLWITLGGVRDLVRMFKALKAKKRDDLDDGMVVGHQNLSDVPTSDVMAEQGR